MSEIYKIVNIINNKIYVGQTKNSLEIRKKRHLNDVKYGSKLPIHTAIRKYGIENFKFETIEYCNIENLDDREKFWIEKLNTLCKNGYNIRNGAYGDQPEEWKKRIRYSSKGRGKKVLSFNPITADIINEYDNLHDAGRKLNIGYQNIYKCVKNYTEKTRKGLGFIYKDDYQKLSDKSKLIISGWKPLGKRGILVYGVNMNNDKIEFDSIMKASKEMKCCDDAIRISIKNGTYCKGYKWYYTNKEKDDNYRDIKVKTYGGKTVLQFNPKTGKILNEFRSTLEAYRKLKTIKSQHIRYCTSDYSNRTAGGFGFIYKSDYDNLIDKSILIFKKPIGKKSIPVYGIDSIGNKIEYTYITQAAIEHNCSRSSIIGSIKKGTKCKGYKWYYKNEVKND